MLWIEDYEKSLSRAMLSGLDSAPSILHIPGVTLYGPRKVEERTPTFIFNEGSLAEILGRAKAKALKEGKPDVAEQIRDKYNVDVLKLHLGRDERFREVLDFYFNLKKKDRPRIAAHIHDEYGVDPEPLIGSPT